MYQISWLSSGIHCNTSLYHIQSMHKCGISSRVITVYNDNFYFVIIHPIVCSVSPFWGSHVVCTYRLGGRQVYYSFCHYDYYCFYCCHIFAYLCIYLFIHHLSINNFLSLTSSDFIDQESCWSSLLSARTFMGKNMIKGWMKMGSLPIVMLTK